MPPDVTAGTPATGHLVAGQVRGAAEPPPRSRAPPASQAMTLRVTLAQPGEPAAQCGVPDEEMPKPPGDGLAGGARHQAGQLDRCSINKSGKMIRPWFRQAAVPWKTTATQTRASGENRVSTKPGVLHYRRLREQAFDGCRLEVTGSAAFHLLHWEALRDPELDVPLAVRLPVTRRVGQLPSLFELPSGQPTLNILLVTARPFGRGDVGYRTISRPLLVALRQGSLPVTVDLVRPGTWEALRAHLRDRTRREGASGWYQVIHLDLHGGFSEYGELDELRSAGRLLFGGVPAVEPFDGRQIGRA